MYRPNSGAKEKRQWKVHNPVWDASPAGVPAGGYDYNQRGPRGAPGPGAPPSRCGPAAPRVPPSCSSSTRLPGTPSSRAAVDRTIAAVDAKSSAAAAGGFPARRPPNQQQAAPAPRPSSGPYGHRVRVATPGTVATTTPRTSAIPAPTPRPTSSRISVGGGHGGGTDLAKTRVMTTGPRPAAGPRPRKDTFVNVPSGE